MNVKDTFTFLSQIKDKNINVDIPPEELENLRKYGLIMVFNEEEYQAKLKEVQQNEELSKDLLQKETLEGSIKNDIIDENKKIHSIFFHFEGMEKREKEMQKLMDEQNKINALDKEIQEEQKKLSAINEISNSILSAVKYKDYYVSLTNYGTISLREMPIKMYRVSDLDVINYIEEESKINQELGNIANLTYYHFINIKAALKTIIDPTYLRSISVGLAKIKGDPAAIGKNFVMAYDQIKSLGHNTENILLSAEILSSQKIDLPKALDELKSLTKEVHKHGVPHESALGIASILYFGKRYDGSYPLEYFDVYKSELTPSYESAAILSLMNLPPTQIMDKFKRIKELFFSWGYTISDDTELSSAYLTISELPVEGISTKLYIITNGMKTYLEYPLVASSILATIPTLEANESLNLLEKAYGYIASKNISNSQPETITLAVRMIQGVKNEIVKGMDPSAPPVLFTYVPTPIFMPLYVAHGIYYQSYSSLGGFHPSHISTMGMGGGFLG